ncbi:hypothetical protein AAG747_17265 [Rapidithrix thailandica]|uniref:Tetratricopeptide repeat protein n=1 Tax=Rapidithrix thailandica TaxID=413964 RepID=A0AAW9S9I3_9BACT
MNYSKSFGFKSLIALVLGMVFISMSAFADGEKITKSQAKVLKKAKAKVEKASPDDWKTYALAAEMCFGKKVNMKEAYEWLKKSIEIKETPLNLRIKGDYYTQNNLPEKAIDAYIKSMELVKAKDPYADFTEIQEKIAMLSKELSSYEQ